MLGGIEESCEGILWSLGVKDIKRKRGALFFYFKTKQNRQLFIKSLDTKMIENLVGFFPDTR